MCPLPPQGHIDLASHVGICILGVRSCILRVPSSGCNIYFFRPNFWYFGFLCLNDWGWSGGSLNRQVRSYRQFQRCISSVPQPFIPPMNITPAASAREISGGFSFIRHFARIWSTSMSRFIWPIWAGYIKICGSEATCILIRDKYSLSW